MANYSCPRCKSLSVHRSRRKGLYEHVAVRLALMRPYRCWSCNYRHYGYLFLRKSSGGRGYASTSSTVFRQIPRTVPLLPLLLFVPWALASTGSDLMLLGMTLYSPAGEDADSPEIQAAARPRSRPVPRILLASTAAPPEVPRWHVNPVTSAQDEPAGKPELAPSRTAPSEREVLGTVNSTGEVSLNGARVPQLATLYADDTIVTGPDGNATIKVQGKGDLEVSPGSSIKFPNSPRYLAQLDHGQISFRPLQQVQGFQVRAGNFVVVPDPGSSETTASIARHAGGVTRVKAVHGSVGIIELEGPRTSFILDGQEVTINPDGSIGGTGLPQPAPAAPTMARAGGGSGKFILIGLGAAGAAGAAIGLSGGGSTTSPSVSPFNP